MCFQVKNKTVSRPHRYTTEEVRDEVFADPDSDFDDESSSNESEEYSPQHSSSEPSESGELSENEDQQLINNENQHACGRGRGRGRGCGRGAPQENRAARGGSRRNRQQEDALLEIRWTSNDRQPQISPFTAHPGLQVQLPNNAGAGDYLSLFLTDAFFDLLVEQTNLYAAQYKAANPNLPPNS